MFRAFGSDLLHPCFALNTLNHGNYGRPGGGFGLGASIIPPFVGLAGGGGHRTVDAELLQHSS